MKKFRHYQLLRHIRVITILLLLLVSNCGAEVVSLPDDQYTGGVDPNSMFWISESEYLDPTIHVKNYNETYEGVTCGVMEIRISLPCQIRTYSESFDVGSDQYSDPEELAKKVNAIAAVNGDFFQLQGRSLTIRQGLLYRETYSATHPQDVLIIDDQGDFWCLQDATQQKMDYFLERELPDGRAVMNTFSEGPLLIRDGEAVTLTDQQSEDHNANYPGQRSAIIQLSAMHYAIVICEGRSDHSKGLTLNQLTRFILKLFPDCSLAYNLDGGGGSCAMLNGTRILRNPNARPIGDILYFASAWAQ